VRPISADHAALGRAIEAVMDENAIKHDALAAAIGMDIKQLGSYIRGQGNPTYTTVLRISRGLGVGPGRLMTIADELRSKD
jgi:transcriptional regulator with XRE-family HTH domain